MASLNDFFEFVGNLLDCLLLRHSGARKGLTSQCHKSTRGVHENGFKIRTYSDPGAGTPFPEEHRSYHGLGLCKTAVDATTNSHIREKRSALVIQTPSTMAWASTTRGSFRAVPKACSTC